MKRARPEGRALFMVVSAATMDYKHSNTDLTDSTDQKQNIF